MPAAMLLAAVGMAVVMAIFLRSAARVGARGVVEAWRENWPSAIALGLVFATPVYLLGVLVWRSWPDVEVVGAITFAAAFVFGLDV
jgi:uncharacterized membrane protein